ncbi:MAG: Ig-like domain-containing protein [Chloroflexota bacterium]
MTKQIRFTKHNQAWLERCLPRRRLLLSMLFSALLFILPFHSPLPSGLPTAHAATDAQATPLLNNVSAVDSGGVHSCVLVDVDGDGRGGVKCWGHNGDGQLGDGTTNQRSTPVDVTNLSAGVTAIVTGDVHSCALVDADGDGRGGVKCWGGNWTGQLGDNSFISRSTAFDVSGLTDGVVAIAAGVHHTCALVDADGDGSSGVKCWGWNGDGQLGDNSFSNSPVPVDVSGLSSHVIAITAGYRHTCAIVDPDGDGRGNAKCWGFNAYGQLGNGSTGPQHFSEPVDVGGIADVIAITAGWFHTCAISDANGDGRGNATCWGYNSQGQLGNGSTSNSVSRPVDVSSLGASVTAISVHYHQTCGLVDTDGDGSSGAKCWGWNHYGQLGNGSTSNSAVPVDVTGLATNVIAIAPGVSHTCAIVDADGDGRGGVKCWGYNRSGQLGNGTGNQSLTPVDVIDPNAGHPPIALDDSATTNQETPATINVLVNDSDPDDDLDATSVSVTSGPSSGSTSVNGTTGAITYTPNPGISGSDSFVYEVCDAINQCDTATVTISINVVGKAHAIGAGYDHSCQLVDAVGPGDGVRCWGDNESGQLGNGTILSSTIPVDVTGLSSGVLAISSGTSNTCALLTSGGLKCWGSYAGNDTSAGQTTPVDVIGLSSDVVAVSAGGPTCALTSAGGVKCWGPNGHGGLGDGTKTTRTSPVDVVGLDANVAAISVGASHVCAIFDLDGDGIGGVKCWGRNGAGQLGDNTLSDRTIPIDVPDLLDGVTAISAGHDHTCALLDPDGDGSGGVKCWGDYVGPPISVGSKTPVDVAGLASGVKAIAAGDNHSCALLDDNTVQCWGLNFVGQLGDGTNIDRRYTPAPVMGLASAPSALSAGYRHTCVLLGNGVAQCWGYNVWGQLGNDTDDIFSNVPIYVAGPGGTQAPVANDDTASTNQATAVIIDVLANDTDVDNDIDPTSVSITDGPFNGTTSINATTGEVTYTPNNDDFITDDTFTYQVCDAVGFCDSADVIITINVPPAEIYLDGNIDGSVDENAPAGTIVGTLTSDDPNFNDTHIYEILSSGDSFEIDGDKLVTKILLDYESGPTDFMVQIRSTDGGGLSVERDIMIMINDVNEAPTDVILNFNQVDENIPQSQLPYIVDTVEATDPDINDMGTHSFSILGEHADKFSVIGSGFAQLRAEESFDFEAQSSYDITLRATDSSGLFLEKVLTILVNDINEEPLAIADSAITHVDTAVDINATANDLDPENGVLTITTVDDPTNGSTATDGTTITYTPDNGFSGDEVFGYTVSDGTLTSVGTVAVVVRDGPTANTPEVAVQTILPGTEATLPFASSAEATATTSVQFPAGALNTVHSFVYLEDVTSVPANLPADFGSAGRHFSLDAYSGGTHQLGFIFNAPVVITLTYAEADIATLFENTLALYYLEETSGSWVEVGGPTSHDEANNTIVFALAHLTEFALLGEMQPSSNLPPEANDDSAIAIQGVGALIDVVANDTDPNMDLDPTTVSVTSGPLNGSTTVDATTGAVTYTSTPSHVGSDNFTYQICDSGGLCDTATVNVMVEMNEPPMGVFLSNDSVDENQPVGTVVGTLTTDDINATDTHTYEIVGGSSDFEIGGPNGDQLMTTVVLDADMGNDFYDLQISVTDSGGFSAEETASIIVNQINEGPTAILINGVEAYLATITVPENIPEDELEFYMIGEITVVDPDMDDMGLHTIAIEGEDAASFDIASFFGPAPILRPTESFDFEEKNLYTIDILAIDPGGSSVGYSGIEIHVTDGNDAPIANSDSVTTTVDTSVSIDVLANDLDGEGDPFNVVDDPALLPALLEPSNGIISINGNAISYMPDPGFTGRDFFEYRVSDGLLSSRGTVMVTVQSSAGGGAQPESEVGAVDPNEETTLTFESDEEESATTTIDVPAGAVSQELVLVYEEDVNAPEPDGQPEGFSLAGRAFTLDAYIGSQEQTDFTFIQPIELTFTYANEDVAGQDESTLQLFYYDEDRQSWLTDGITLISHDLANNTIVFTVDHLTDFGLLGRETVSLQERMSESLASFSYDSEGTDNGAILGTLYIDFNFYYNSGDPLENIFFEVTRADNSFLQTHDGTGAGGVGSILSIDNSDLPDDISPAANLFEETENLTVAFDVGVSGVPWALNFEMYGIEVSGTQAASRVPLATFTVDSSMVDLENAPQGPSQVVPSVYLPLVGQ